MYHSITFGDKNTWEDWHLIPSSRPVFNPPTQKTTYVSIPGSDVVIDLSEIHTGYPAYEYRTGSFEFIVDNGHEDWSILYSEIMNYLHGKRMKAILEDDPGYYYEGRFSVKGWKSEHHNSKITIDYYVAPYKYEVQSSTEDWEWDTLDFRSGIIREYGNIRVTVDEPVTLKIEPNSMRTIPTIIVSYDDKAINSGMSVTYNNKTVNLRHGNNVISDLVITEDLNTLVFTADSQRSEGLISVDYRGGSL